jgi:hypothetical protein
MTVTYTIPTINDRLQGDVTAIDDGGGNGYLVLLNNTGIALSTISLNRPSGTVNGGVLTFSGTLLDPSAAKTDYATEGRLYNSAGSLRITGLTVGIPLGVEDILITNGLNSTLISSGQVVSLLSAQITGS